jgi:hypothetical protein
MQEKVLLRRHFKLCGILSKDIAVQLTVVGDQSLAERAVILSILYRIGYDGVSKCTKLPVLSNCIYPQRTFFNIHTLGTLNTR